MVVLSIIILNYNTKKLTTQCLSSILKQYKIEFDKGLYELIVIDNASIDDSARAIKTLLSGKSYSQIIENKSNTGFTKGNNIGSKKAQGKYFFFLNSDTEIVDIGLNKMIEFLDNNQHVGILGGKLINSDRSTQKSAGNFYNVFNIIFLLLGFERLGFLRSSPKNTCQVDWVTGASMMIRNDLFKELKGFDENIFMYIEDMEICFRAKKKGFLTYFFSDITIIHKERGSSNRTFAITSIYKGILYYFKKHKSFFEYRVVQSLLIGKAILLIFFGKIVNNTYLISTYEKALTIS